MKIQEQVPLKNFSTLKVGGPAEFFFTVDSEEQLCEAVEFAHARDKKVTVLGGGSNVLIPDDGLAGLVIKNEIKGWEETKRKNEVHITIGAGEVFDEVVAKTVEKEYWGLENLSHIPGSMGAAPVQNIGAYGIEIGNLIKEVVVLNTESKKLETLSASECRFGYRHSFFKEERGKKYIITAVTCVLNTTPKPILEYRDIQEAFKDIPNPTNLQIREAVIAIRAKKFPDWTRVGTAGSFFKNPIISGEKYEQLRKQYPQIPGFQLPDTYVKVPLGWILDHVCNLKGVQKGNVGTYKNQALVLVHNGNATAKEVIAFARYVADVVLQKTNIAIEWEVTKLS